MISNYTELRSSISRWGKRQDATELLDDFIFLAEVDMWKTLRVRSMEKRATATAPTSDRFLSLPDSYLEMRKMQIFSGSKPYPLEYYTPESLNVKSSAGRPSSYTITSQLEFNRTSDSGYTVEMHYYKSPDGITSSNTTNAVLTKFPSIYLYGSLMHFFQWAHDDKKLVEYAGFFHNAIELANKMDRKGRYGAAKSMKTERSTP
jgi:hypothetical protein